MLTISPAPTAKDRSDLAAARVVISTGERRPINPPRPPTRTPDGRLWIRRACRASTPSYKERRGALELAGCALKNAYLGVPAPRFSTAPIPASRPCRRTGRPHLAQCRVGAFAGRFMPFRTNSNTTTTNPTYLLLKYAGCGVFRAPR